MRRLITTTLLLGLAAPAWAGWGEVKTMREPMPRQEVERSLTMPRGWLEFGLGYDYKIATGHWTDDGDVDEFEATTWTYGTAALDVRYGITRRAEIWWHMPVHHARLVNDDLGTDTSDASIGDPVFGWRVDLYESEAPRTSVVFEAHYKAPAAQEAPGTYIGGPLNVAGFVFTTGTPDLQAGFGAKRQFGPLALSGHVAYKKRFSNVVQYLVDLNEYQFSGRIKPGDQVLADVGLTFQVGPVALQAEPRFVWRADTRIGTTSGGWNPATNLDPVANSAGTALDLKAMALVHVTRGMDVSVGALFPLMGHDLQFFPIEDLHPTYGTTYGGTLELRY